MKHAVDNANSNSTPALVVGASGRMVAAELVRLGIECSVADLYGDSDTAQICQGRVHKLDRLSDLLDRESLVRAHRFVVFAGGLEGNLKVAEKLAIWSKPVFPDVSSLQQINDVARFNHALLQAGIDRHSLSNDPANIGLPAVVKDVTHSATATLVHSESECRSLALPNRIFQKFIEGESVSQLYVAEMGNIECLGGTIQLTESLAWVGSISGLKLAQKDKKTAFNFAVALLEQSKFTGIFGIDFVRNKHGIWPVDVNPRIPASLEVLGGFAMQRHLRAFGIECKDACERDAELIFGKAVVFNRSDTAVQFVSKRLKGFSLRHLTDPQRVSIGDVPHDGESIKPGHPILTVFASGETQTKVKSNLSTLRREILERLSRKNA